MRLPDRMLKAWYAYWQIEPWEEERADLRAGLQSAHFHKSMTGESVSIDKFLPDFNTDPKTRAQKELDAAVQSWEALCEEE